MFKNKRLYSFREFNSIIKENADDFKPVIGKGVKDSNKKNNKDAVDDILSQTKKYDSKMSNNQEFDSEVGDENKTTLDYDFDFEPSDEYKERVKSQVHGYPSAENEKSHKNDNDALRDGNKKFYDKQKNKNKKNTAKEQDDKAAGLKSRKLDKKLFKDYTLFKNEAKGKTMKLVNFKHTLFVNEENMLKKVPDCMKTDGNRFIMMDMSGTQYLVECKMDDKFHFAKLSVINKCNPETLKEQFKRIKELSEYDSGKYFARQTCSERLNENREVEKMINNIRDIEWNNNVNKN